MKIIEEKFEEKKNLVVAGKESQLRERFEASQSAPNRSSTNYSMISLHFKLIFHCLFIYLK